LLKRPMVVTYKVLWLSYWIRRPEFYLPYFALPNILAGRFVVPEILQDEATPEVLCQALTNQVFDKVVRSRLEREFTTLHDRLRQNTGERVVAELLPLIQKAVPAIADGAPAAGTEAVST